MKRTMRGLSRRLATAAALLGVWLAAAAVQAGPVVDGSLAEWGIIVPTNASNLLGYNAALPPLTNKVPFTGVPNDHGTFPVGYPSTFKTTGLPGEFGYTYMLEDTNQQAYLEPQSGGQPFDLEFMGVTYDKATNTLYVAIASGQRVEVNSGVPNTDPTPANPSAFSPGDLQITTKSGAKFGVETGGHDGATTGTIFDGAPGTTWTGNSSGFATGFTEHGGSMLAGSIWSTAGATNDGWLLDFLPGQAPFPPNLQAQIDYSQVGSGNTLVGTADYVFTRNQNTGRHSVIELAIDLDYLGLTSFRQIASVRWQTGCGNDILDVLPVPVPGALVMLATCLVPAGAFVRRWSRAAAK